MTTDGLTTFPSLKLSAVTVADRRYAVLYDISSGDIEKKVTDFSIYLSDTLLLDPKTVDAQLWHIKRLFDFLSAINRKAEDLDDKLLERFRDEEFNAVKSRANSGGQQRPAQRTVNAKLRTIYGFLTWIQEQRMATLLIGPADCRVRSTLPLRRTDKTRFQADRDLYPLLFRHTGAKSRHATKHWATEDQCDQLRA